ncbi:hypothetical protein B0I35DRAFT_90327 [Stachybotrys elegans]|uniref:Uncharacterized protein n=1 Tax=Stachybotrys elegans TaxID=80388 RepID=A0A8K0SMQ7_9HYPO|nr:hypothetical protein B0I35DRAFT_90327 [Stachybotrys elegans]
MAWHVKVEQHCIFCNDALLVRPCFRQDENLPDQDLGSIGLCFLVVSPDQEASEQQKTQTFFFTADLLNFALNQDFVIDRLPEGDPREYFDGPPPPRFCYETWCCRCEGKNVVRIAHFACYHIAKQVKKDLALEDLPQIATMRRPLLHPRHSRHAAEPRLRSLNPLLQLAGDTELGRLLSDVGHSLPPELTGQILGYLEGGIRSLLECSRVVEEYQEQVRRNSRAQSPSILCFPFQGCTVEQVGANFFTVLGETCIKQLGPGGVGKFEEEVAVPRGLITGIHVFLGTYGVVGLTFLLRDGSKAHIGSRRCRWISTDSGSDLEGLKVVSDGFKIVRAALTPQAAASQLQRPRPMTAYWDRLPRSNTRSTGRYSVIDFRAQMLSLTFPGLPTARIFEYLNLRDEDVRCVTMWSTHLGTCGIQLNEDPRKRIGDYDENCVSITHFLAKGETIRAMYLVGPFLNMIGICGPFPALVTSRGRTLYYGVQRSEPLVDTRVSGFDMSATEELDGIFFDPSNVYQEIFSYGAAVSHSPDPTRTTNMDLVSMDLVSMEPSRRTFVTHPFMIRRRGVAFLTRARIDGVRRITAQHEGGWCRGLRIDRHDGTADTLGQWNPCYNGGNKVLYKPSYGSILYLVFKYGSLTSVINRVYRVYVIATKHATTNRDWSNTFIWSQTQPHREIAWWFTAQGDDVRGFDGPAHDVDLDGRIPSLPLFTTTPVV